MYVVLRIEYNIHFSILHAYSLVVCLCRSDGLGLRESVRSQHRHPLAPHAEPTGMGALQDARADTQAAGGLATALGVRAVTCVSVSLCACE